MKVSQPRSAKILSKMGDLATIFGILNAMVGDQLFVLPVLSISSGYLTTLIISVITGYVNYLTARLLVIHLGKQEDIRKAILVHFGHNKKYVKAFSFFIWLSFLPIFFSNFKLICLQVQGLMGYHSQIVGPLTVVSIITLIIIIRKYHIGEETNSYGIISIIFFLVFIVWALISAPSGTKKVQPFGDSLQYASVLMSGYSVHSFLAQNIVKNPNRKTYSKLILYSFIAGMIIFTNASYGSFALINRQADKIYPETIQDYFRAGQWQLHLLQIIYLIHLVTVLPNFVIVSKVQFLNLFDIQVSHEISWAQVAYIVATVLISYLTYVFSVSLINLMVVNGSLFCYIFVIVMPIVMHLRCVYYNRSSGAIQGEEQLNVRIFENQCKCNNTYSSKNGLYIQTFFWRCFQSLDLFL